MPTVFIERFLKKQKRLTSEDVSRFACRKWISPSGKVSLTTEIPVILRAAEALAWFTHSGHILVYAPVDS
ncbi:hypothetical protein C7G83_17195 [Siccibacter turicensis]|uniref:Uncharacterized protein n=1 Tax=Siccibacter turicensis TaxID=357233 RepID=A0A2P8VFG9_9ENTR|nr:hypothetical protein C7G83_17195 [Siccibacter turicensis]